MSTTSVSAQAAFSAFDERLLADGLRPALAYLLSLTDFRFIALFRNHGEQATAVVFYDRENPQTVHIDEVPACSTYCHLANQARAVFSTSNALQDPRLESHPTRHTVLAYWGLPVITPEGEILGTLCHYDVVPRDTSQVNLELMVAVASAIEQRHLMPPYPAPDAL